MMPNEYSYYLQLERQLTVIQAESNRLLEVWRTRDDQRLEQIQHLEERLTHARWVRRQMHGTNRRQWERIQELLNQHMRSDETICDLCAEIRDLQAKIAELKPKAASYDELTAPETPEDAPNG
jgi:uncharacterized protein YoaH (UPF0181 family)